MRDYGLKTNLLIDNKINTKELKQFDQGNKITIQVYEAEVLSEDKIIQLTDTDTAIAIYERPDGMVFDRSCTIENGCIVTYTDKQILALSGQLKLEFVIKRGDTETTTHTIIFNVVKSLDRNSSIESDPNYRSDLVSDLLTIKADYVARINTIDGKVNTNTTNINTLKSSKVDNVTYNTTNGILDFKGNNNSLVTVDLPIPELQQDVATLYKNNVVVSSFAQLKTALLNKGTNCSKILIKAGTYSPTESLEIPAYTYIAPFGNGKVIFNCNNSSVNNIFRNKLNGTETEYNGASNITIEGITFNGVNTTNTITPVAFAHAENCKVINCTFKNFNTWHNIEFNGCSYCYADYCKFLNYGLTSGGSPTEVVQIDYCGSSDQYPWNCNYDNTACNHIFVRHCEFQEVVGTCLGNHSFNSSLRHNNIYFENNYIVHADYAVFMGDVNNAYIRYNKTEGCRTFVELKEGSGQHLYNWYIENNDVDLVQGGTFHGVNMEVNTEGRFCRLEATNSSTRACINGLFINGNHINNANTHGITFTANFVECNNNFVRGCGKIGIFAYGCSQGNIMNNVVADCGKSNVTNRNFAIAIGDNGNFDVWRVNCANNTCFNIAVLGGVGSTYVHDNIGKIVEINSPSFINNNNHDI